MTTKEGRMGISKGSVHTGTKPPALQASDTVALKNDQLIYLACTSSFARLVGLSSPSDVIGKTDFDLFPRAYARSLMRQDSQVMFTAGASIDAIRLDPANVGDASRQALILRTPVYAQDRRVQGLDVRLLSTKGAFDERPDVVPNFQSLISEATQGSLIVTRHDLLFADIAAATVLGHTSAQAMLDTCKLSDLLINLELARAFAAAPTCFTTSSDVASERLTLVARAHNGSPVRLVVRCTVVQWGDESALLICFVDAALPVKTSSGKTGAAASSDSKERATGSTSQIGSQADALRRLQSSEQRYRHYVSAGADFFWEMDAVLTISVISQGFSRVLGIAREQVVGRKLTQILSHPGNVNKASHWKGHLRDLLEKKPFRDFEFRWCTQGEVRVIRYSGIPVFNRARQFVGYRGMGCDVTAAVRQAETTAYYANHDTLTGLTNRRSFENAVSIVLDNAQKRHESHAICFMDLDKFKIVNDTCGHQAGDELLKQLTRLFESLVRKSDVLARVGGDEFAILLYQCDVTEALKLANQIRQEVENFVFVWEDNSFTLGVSIGIVLIDDHWENMESLFNAADSSCYIAKNSGGNRVVVYREGEDIFFDRKIAAHWYEQISGALKENRLRLEMPDGELVSPTVFLPAAERYGLASALDERALALTLDWLVANPELQDAVSQIGLNFSASSCADAEFVQRMARMIDDSGVQPCKLCFEVSECAAIANLSTVSEFMEELSTKGCLFSIDRFGAGLSSFAFLRKLPVDFVKIDGLLVRDILTDPTDFSLVKAISDISKSMGKQTVAQCVESSELLEAVKKIGIDYGQGYHLSQPELVVIVPIIPG